MKTIVFLKKAILFIIVSISLSTCSSSNDSDTNINNVAEYENKIVGIWTGTYQTELTTVFKRYIFNDSHVVRLYTKTGHRVGHTSNGVTTYSNWDITEENQVGEWSIIDKGYTADLHIEWNGGSSRRETFSLFNFSGAKLNNGGWIYIYKGDSYPDF